ncbi:transposase [Nodosilinea sp. LEGE 06152]|uniref:transposase n=1 Tax=Nodosilinea sp. LEGE 06152 TaxID=2777966 RepID=UPI0018828A67|nr:transposase [Nodosilinea sp. LEGE 06152]MBE9159831.1 transposase [Nodosilinea sp. LEGE 06152]
MAPKKLTEADKTSILSLYRQPQETTSTLAERYGVSNSTISRLLKASLPEDEYSILIQQKRGTTDKVTVPPALPQADAPAKAKPRRQKTADPDPEVSVPAADLESANLAPGALERGTLELEDLEPGNLELEDLEPASPALLAVDKAPAPPAKPTRKRRSSGEEAPAVEAEPEPEVVVEVPPEPTQLSIPDPAPAVPEKPARPVLKSAQAVAPVAAVLEADETIEATNDLDDDWDDAVLGDDYGDDDDEGDDDEGYAWEGSDRATPNLGILEISPLTADALPPLCYVVVERTSSELVVLPLRTFADLGQIPEAEGDSRTLPVFENHNVARRFSRRNQRVVKVPDGSLLQTTSPYLQAKGITRLLIDGQVFSLGSDPVEPLISGADE